MSKYIRASVRHEIMVEIDDNQGLFALAEAIPSLKDKMLRDLKKAMVEKANKLTVDMLTFEEVIIPDSTKQTNNIEGA